MADLAGAIIKSMAAHERKPADFYPTPVDATYSLAALLAMVFQQGDLILEPACGDGRLARVLKWCGYEVLATDLFDRGYGEAGIDFLDRDNDYGEVAGVITNPPFDKGVEFIERALDLSPNVFMFQKVSYWNAISRYDLFQKNRPTIFMPLTWRPAFLEKERGSSPLMDCAWCIWIDPEVWESYGICGFEPLLRAPYPGYADIGLEVALRQFGVEINITAAIVREIRTWLLEHQKGDSKRSAESLLKLMASFSGTSKEKLSTESLIPFVDTLMVASSS